MMQQKHRDFVTDVVENAHGLGLIDKNDEFITGCFLRHNKLVYHTKNEIKGISKFGLMFLNSSNPKRLLVENYFKNKYLTTKHKDIFVYVWDLIIEDRKIFELFRKSIDNYEYEKWESEWENKIAQEIKSNFNEYDTYNSGNIKKIVGYSKRVVMVGTYPLYFLPYNQARKTYRNFKVELNNLVSGSSETISIRKDRVSLYEVYLEAFIRKNFVKLFPNLKIIDDNRQYRTNDNNFIDILAKEKTNEYIYIIELKRYKIPQKALTQLLDYMNQIKKELKTNKVRGILICSEIDRRLESAIEMINQGEELVSLKMFDISIQ